MDWDTDQPEREHIDPQGDPRATQGPPPQHYCYTCGTPWPPEWAICDACGSEDRAADVARPLRAVPGDHKTFPGPWKLLPWPGQGAAAVYGGPGAGKSSLAAMLKPTQWLTKEQAPKAAGDMLRRIIPDHMPQIHAVKDPKQVYQILQETFAGPIVVDSLTAFGLREALVIGHMLVDWARKNDDRSLAILQVNKGGDAAGYKEITHLFDAICNLTPDKWGVRIFEIEKSRWSPLGSLYWTFDDAGQIAIPEFNAAYSVEGAGGTYWLHPFPMKGAKWSGLLTVMGELGLLKPGVASAAVIAPYMPDRFLKAMDHIERRRFAEAQNLEWLEPADLFDNITAALEARELTWADL